MKEHVLEHLLEVLNESLAHTGVMFPLLFLVFLLVETVSNSSASSRITSAFSQPFIGPVAASALGLIPQCGFSVVATTLFLEGMIPMGSLLATFISTSDEAIPVMLSDRASLPWVLPLLATKLVWGTVAGICTNVATLQINKSRVRSNFGKALKPGTHGHNPGCGCSCAKGKSGPIEMASHALYRAIRTSTMVFIFSAIFGFIGHVAKGRVSGALSQTGLWQPVVSALIGLVPSCATSVALAESFRTGMLSFPSTLSGLISNSGLGLLVLLKEAKNKGDVVTVIALLLFAAILAGFLASMILPSGLLMCSR